MRRSIALTAVAVASALILTLVLAGVIDLGSGPSRPRSPGNAAAKANPSTEPVVTTPAPVVRTTAPPGAAAACTGRVVDWNSGRPLAGCKVLVGDATEALTDGQGRFRAATPDALAVEVQVTAPRRLTLVRRIAVTTDALALGDVRLRAASHVGGMLCDEQGQPCANANILLRIGSQPPRNDGWRERFATRARTSADGSFRFDSPLPADHVEVEVPGLTPLVGPTSFALEPDTDRFLQLVCRSWGPSDVITGVVLDRLGHGIAQALVQAMAGPDHDASTKVAWAHAEADGSFRLIRCDSAPAPVWLTATGRQPSQRAGSDAAIAWGSRDVEVRLLVDNGVSLQVVDAATGAPIEGYAVQCVPASGVRSPAAGALRNDGNHDGGWTWLNPVAPGANILMVWPHDRRWLPSLPHDYDLEQSGGVVRVALQRAVPCPVRVMTATGAVVAGARVELLVPAAGNLVRDHAALLEHGGSRSPVAIRVASAITDADGRAVLRWFGDPRDLELRVRGPGTPHHVERGVRIDAGGVTVRVPSSGQLQVHLSGASGARVTLQEIAGGRQLPPSWAEPLVLDEQGRATVEVPVGTWQLSAWTRAPNSGGAASWLPAPDSVGSVTISASQTTRLHRDLSAALATGELSGVAFVDGKPADHLVLRCGVPDGAGGTRILHSTSSHADADGRFRFPNLRAGLYRLQLGITCSGRRVTVPAGAWLRLSPGEDRLHEPVGVMTAAARVLLHDAHGNAVTSGRLVLRSDAGIALLGTPDIDGWVALDRVPLGRYRLSYRRGRSAIDVGELGVASASPNELSIVIR